MYVLVLVSRRRFLPVNRVATDQLNTVDRRFQQLAGQPRTRYVNIICLHDGYTITFTDESDGTLYMTNCKHVQLIRLGKTVKCSCY